MLIEKKKKNNGVEIKQFKIHGNWVGGMKGEIEDYRQFLLNSDFDIVTNFAAQQWATDIALPILEKITAKKVFVPTGFSAFYNPEYQNYFSHLKNWMKQYDMNIFLSHDYRDIDFAKTNGITKNTIIPNGASMHEFSSNQINIRENLGISQDEFLILLVGSFSGSKGHKEALEIFLKSDLKKSTLLMIGNNYENFKRKIMLYPKFYWLKFLNLSKQKKIIITYISRKETVEAYKAADLFLFPSNIECSPIVLFECMASKTPFLTTDVGNAKEIIELSQGGMLLPTKIDGNGYSHAKIPESVKMLNELYLNSVMRKQLMENGYKTWKEKFTWEIISEKYLTLYQNILNQSSG
ncbi:MAG: glycosyltransferase family 4 protein [Bacteroidota bacterium]